MRENDDVWKKHGAELAVITPSAGDYNAQFLEKFGPYPFPVYGDPRRKAYKALGHVTMPKLKLLTMAAAGGVTGKIKNFLPKEKGQRKFVADSMKIQDVYIQGGTWIFNSDSELVWNHIDSSPEDYASLEDIEQILEQIK
ncbi:peroxiredoxin-like family protein [Alkalicoccus halolimnae]|uniref:Peroxiredoxin-like family protein n=1 Tax=Alkalicoccus halolimnae TaxID=1667239 RepID=A0AAJ8LY41_9BACI